MGRILKQGNAATTRETIVDECFRTDAVRTDHAHAADHNTSSAIRVNVGHARILDRVGSAEHRDLTVGRFPYLADNVEHVEPRSEIDIRPETGGEDVSPALAGAKDLGQGRPGLLKIIEATLRGFRGFNICERG